ncbi:MAG TPA: hypothetical protein VFJ69_03045, partial [Actinomycetota bacterium]|nr:hypothetical protein [Actinomycetota bacterium]
MRPLPLVPPDQVAQTSLVLDAGGRTVAARHGPGTWSASPAVWGRREGGRRPAAVGRSRSPPGRAAGRAGAARGDGGVAGDQGPP